RIDDFQLIPDCLDFNRLANRADLQAYVDVTLIRAVEDDALDLRLLEPCGFDAERIGSRRNRGKRIVTRAVRYGLADVPGKLVRQDYRGTGDGSTRTVGDRSCQRGCNGLAQTIGRSN